MERSHPAAARGGTLAFRSRLNRAVMLIGCAVFMVVGVAMVASPSDTSAVVLGLAITALFGWMTVRLLMAGLEIRADVVRIRGFVRTKVLPLSALRCAHEAESSSLLPWRILTLETVDGELIAVEEVAQLSDRRQGPVHRAIAAINARLDVGDR